MQTKKANQIYNDFDSIKIGIASPEQIKEWAKSTACHCNNYPDCNCGEVTKPETINYRTFKPEKNGLFCEAIFGPKEDWKCACGKYEGIKHKGIICERCGVEVTRSKVRRERMGYIQLAAPVTHIWFFKEISSSMATLLGMKYRDIERIVYFESYVVIEKGQSSLQEKQLLTEEEYLEHKDRPGFSALIGAAAMKELLSLLDLDEEIEKVKTELEETGSKQKTKKFLKRLRLLTNFKKSGNKPEWMVLDVIPVIPPELRPLVPLDGGRFATSDLNDLYRRVINRNNRLKHLISLRAPDVIIRNEKRMLQEAVDALFDNGRHGKVVRGPRNRQLKSLSDSLKGKTGRFRQNLLGKRVDYSGRSVIVIEPKLELHQCGLPKKMVLELFKPFIIQKLTHRGYAQSIKSAKKMAEKITPEVWEVLEEVISEHPVLLNRAPTLHRLGIQAFEPKLVEGDAIRINPLICQAFNADFDGDQMAVHVPLTQEAQIEAKALLIATRNLLKPAHGHPIAKTDLDIVLGCSYLTKQKAEVGSGKTEVGNGKEEGQNQQSATPLGPLYKWGGNQQSVRRIPVFRYSESGLNEVIAAHNCGELGLHDSVKLSHDGNMIETTVGRVIFNSIVPDDLIFEDEETGVLLPFINQEIRSEHLKMLVTRSYEECGSRKTVEFLDKLKELGFHYATLSGITISTSDMIIPPDKEELKASAQKEVDQINKDYQAGNMSPGERYNKVIQAWSNLTMNVQDSLIEALKKGNPESDLPPRFNPAYIMVDSGARSKKEPWRQLAGMRGLMSKPSGEIIEQPIFANFREGLTVLDYFISTHGARKGLADTAIKTASSGYLTRRLVDVAQDVTITEEDCGTLNGVVKSFAIGGEESEAISSMILGRIVVDDVVHPATGEVIAKADSLINFNTVKMIEDSGVPEVKVRSVLTCETGEGVCRKCYGMDLTTGDLVDIGETIGIIAAQSIGEPGTQLTMRTFHTGGAISGSVEQSHIEAKNSGIVKYHDIRVAQRKEEDEIQRIVLTRNGIVSIVDSGGKELERHKVEIGATIYHQDGQKVEKGDLLLEWDPYHEPILTEHQGIVRYGDIEESVTMREEIDEDTGLTAKVIINYSGENLQACIEIIDDNRAKSSKSMPIASYPMPTGAHISVNDGQRVFPGDTLARIPPEISKSKDIVAGLPRVIELFEARAPKDSATIADIEGDVKFEGMSRGSHLVKIFHGDIESGPYRIKQGKHIIVSDGETVKAGQRLTDGPINPNDILQIEGESSVQNYLVSEVQKVYRNNGEEINDKHIEVIVRQMMRKVKIQSPGDTDFLEEEEIDKTIFRRENRKIMSSGGQPTTAQPILQGITKAALTTESFISAASFQRTTGVLTEAALNGKRDDLKGLKENVIVGRLIPAGTGLPQYRRIEVTASDH